MAKIKGYCRNIDGCDLAADKVEQEVEKSNFVCQECGKPLTPIDDGKKPDGSAGGPNKMVIIGIVAAVVIVGGILAAVSLGGGESKPEQPEVAKAPVATVNSDSIAAAQAEAELQKERQRSDSLAKVAAEAQQKTAQAAPAAPVAKPAAKSSASSGSKNLGYAIYKGGLKNGKPDGVNATLTFKTSHVIDSRDPKGRVAEAGDYVIGEFSEGHLVQGIWYGADNQVKGSVIIGK